MPEPAVDWMRVVERLAAGDRMAYAQFGRLITGYLIKLRAYDFREDWDDLRQEVTIAVVGNVRAGRLRDSRALAAYVRVITRNKFVDRLKQHLRCRPDERLPWDDETARAMAADEPDPRLRDLWQAQRFPVVLVTHDLREATYLADTVYCMSKRPGRIIAKREIDLPRPRDLEITYSERFTEIVHELRAQIGRVRKG